MLQTTVFCIFQARTAPLAECWNQSCLEPRCLQHNSDRGVQRDQIRRASWLADRLRVFDPRQSGEGGGVAFFHRSPAVGACDAVRSPRFLSSAFSLSGLFCVWHFFFFFSCFVPDSCHLDEMCSFLALKFVGADMIRKAGLTARAWPGRHGTALEPMASSLRGL